MQRKKMTLRFDLDRPEDRRAWEDLQGLNPASMNKAVLTIINHADRANRVQGMIRSIFQEELAAALLQAPVQPVRAEPEGDDGMDDTIMGFLDNFM